MASIINGLFAGRAGISSHGSAIAVSGDNISNSNTIGYKANRAEFEDLMAGEGVIGRQVGSGSSVATVSTIFEQGTLEFTGRPLDLGIAGTGYFVVAKEDQRYFTRAGNFKVDSAGFATKQPTCRHTTDKYRWILSCKVHTNTIPQDRPATKGARRIDRYNGNREPLFTVLSCHIINER